jgi:hypothetical protein
VPRTLPRDNSIYSPTLDQAVLTRLIDLEMARQNSRSFRRLCKAVMQVVDAMDQGQTIVTP